MCDTSGAYGIAVIAIIVLIILACSGFGPGEIVALIIGLLVGACAYRCAGGRRAGRRRDGGCGDDGNVPQTEDSDESFCPDKDGSFCPDSFVSSAEPGPRPPSYAGAEGAEGADSAGSAGSADTRTRTPYLGAIETDDYELDAGDTWEHGHRDALEPRREGAPEGNPFNLSRTAAPVAAGPGVDDEANDDALDSDERMVLSSKSRNDATRVTAGTMNRRTAIDDAFREELDEAEDRQWWGAHEY